MNSWELKLMNKFEEFRKKLQVKKTSSILSQANYSELNKKSKERNLDKGESILSITKYDLDDGER